MELCLGKGDEPDEILCFRIPTTTVGICYRPSDQEEADGAFFRQLREASHSQALVLMKGT